MIPYREGSPERTTFLSYCKRDPVGMANLCGLALGQNPIYLEDFISAFGKSLFTQRSVPQRIDFLYGLDSFKNIHKDKENDFHNILLCGVQDGIPWIVDISGDYGYLGIALFRRLDLEGDVYAIRPFLPDKYKDDPPDLSWSGPMDVLEGIIGDTISVREKACPNNIEHGYAFWNFSLENDKVEVPTRSDGFRDITFTMKISTLLVATTNMLGFENTRRIIDNSVSPQ